MDLWYVWMECVLKYLLIEPRKPYANTPPHGRFVFSTFFCVHLWLIINQYHIHDGNYIQDIQQPITIHICCCGLGWCEFTITQNHTGKSHYI